MTHIAFTWIGHSTFLFEFDDKKVLLDPFITGNPAATVKADDIHVDLIVVSHGHGDHIADVVSVANRTGAKVLSNFEIANWFGKNGLKEGLAVGMNTGGSFDAGFVRVKYTIAFHSSTMPDGSAGGFPQGFILTARDGRKVYFAGDTALFGDMRLYGDEGLALAIIPIGDHYTMGIDDSVRATNFLHPKFVAPMHYNTFPAIKQDGAAWALRISSETQASPIVLQPGERYVLPE